MTEQNPLQKATPLIFERSASGRRGTTITKPDVPTKPLNELLPASALRTSPPALPEAPEHEVVRHFTSLSLKNHHVDKAFYPLGSCTMKYNPKVNEMTARLAGLGDLNPFHAGDLLEHLAQFPHQPESPLDR